MQTADWGRLLANQFVSQRRLTDRDGIGGMIELQFQIDLALRNDRAATQALAWLLARRRGLRMR